MELSTFTTALVTSTFGFQPAMVPSSVENRKTERWPGTTSKAPLKALKTVPVGADAPSCPLGGGIVTTRLCASPVPSYRVESPVPLSEIHQGEPEDRDMPQAFTRFGSILGTLATFGLSAVKSVLVKCCAVALLAVSNRAVKIIAARAAKRFEYLEDMQFPPEKLLRLGHSPVGSSGIADGDN